MKIDLESWLLATAAAGLLLTGGAFLRAALFSPLLVPASAGPARAVPGAGTSGQRSHKDAELAELRAQLASAIATKEALRAELAEQRQRAERQVQEAQAEHRARSADVNAMAPLSGEVADLKHQLATVTDERDSIRAKAEALERLVEGVRARSRELAEQVKALKGEPT